MSFTHHQHFVPQFYLRQFGTKTPHKKRIHEFQRLPKYDYIIEEWTKSNGWKKQNIYDVCAEECLYEFDNGQTLPNHIEHCLGIIETLYNNSMTQFLNTIVIRYNCNLMDIERSILEFWMSLQIMRHPLIIKFTKAYISQTNNLSALTDTQIKNGVLSAIFNALLVPAGEKIKKNNTFIQDGIRSLFEKMHCTIYVSRSLQFVTSSFPITVLQCIDPSKALYTDLTQIIANTIIFSLSPSVCLEFHLKNHDNEKIIIASDDIVKDINYKIINFAKNKEYIVYTQDKNNIGW